MNIMIVNQDVPSVLNIKITNMMNKASSLIRKNLPNLSFLEDLLLKLRNAISGMPS